MRTYLAVLLSSCVLATIVLAKPAPKEGGFFYVYANKGDRVNHFAPSGWMGDYGDLKLNDADATNPADGKTSTKWTYTAKGTQGANWAGVFYQQPPNNWGDKPGGYDLSGFKKFTFWARGENGGEILKEVKVGGISGEHGDSGEKLYPGEIVLEKTWKKYTIDLADANMSHTIGGFCWVTNRDAMPDGMTVYFDEMRYEK